MKRFVPGAALVRSLNCQPASGKAAACGCGPPVKVDLAASGDLAYTIGGDAATHDRGADVRVWRFRPGSGWTLLADLVAAAD